MKEKRVLMAYDVEEKAVQKLYKIAKRYLAPYQRSVLIGELDNKNVGYLVKDVREFLLRHRGHVLIFEVKEILVELGEPYRRQTRDLFRHRFSNYMGKILERLDRRMVSILSPTAISESQH